MCYCCGADYASCDCIVDGQPDSWICETHSREKRPMEMFYLDWLSYELWLVSSIWRDLYHSGERPVVPLWAFDEWLETGMGYEL
jgi:hypothetical protein